MTRTFRYRRGTMSHGGISYDRLRSCNYDNLGAAGAVSVEEAWLLTLQNAARPIPLRVLSRRGGAVYQPESPVDRLLERTANRVLAERLEVRQADRNKIVTDLASLLCESTPLRVYRLDITSFFESVSTDILLNDLQSRWDVGRDVTQVVRGVCDAARALGVRGLPRGLSTSSTLAEHYLRDFDEAVRSEKHVYFYARFVDDIVILTTGSEERTSFLQKIDGYLRLLQLARNQAKGKQHILDWSPSCSLEYLGYRFSLVNEPKKGRREVAVDVAPAKLRRFKTKVCLALMEHVNRPDDRLLNDRLSVLSGNYVVGRRSKDEALRAGVFYSYVAANTYEGLSSLDTFLRQVLFGSRLSLSQRARRVLTSEQRRELLRFSFVAGRRDRRMCSHSRVRMSVIRACWSHV